MAGNSKQKLFMLLQQYRLNLMKVADFCTSFERAYNLEVDKSELSLLERQVFSDLFDKVVWYSPFDDERKLIANYLGENDIRDSANQAATRLTTVTGLEVRSTS